MFSEEQEKRSKNWKAICRVSTAGHNRLLAVGTNPRLGQFAELAATIAPEVRLAERMSNAPLVTLSALH